MPDGNEKSTSKDQVAAQQSSAKGEIISHTSLRGVGAIGVIIYHYLYIYAPDGSRLTLLDYLPNYAFILELFFINSGFIMSYMYADFFANRISQSSATRFFWARFARIYPVHILTLALFAVGHTVKYLVPAWSPDAPMVIYFTPPETLYSLIASVLMVHAWGFTHSLSWNFQSWAVSAEFAAYLLFPLMCLIIGRFKWVGMILVFAASMALYWWMDYLFKDLNAPGYYGAPRCVAGFALGCVVYRFMPLIRMMSTRALHALQALSIVAALALYGFAPAQILVVFSVALLLLATSENRGWLSDLFAWYPLRFLGQISFTLYMTHTFAGMAARPVILLLGNAVGDTQSVGWSIAVVGIKSLVAVPFAYLVFQYFEMPVRDWLLLWAKKRRTAATVTN